MASSGNDRSAQTVLGSDLRPDFSRTTSTYSSGSSSWGVVDPDIKIHVHPDLDLDGVYKIHTKVLERDAVWVTLQTAILVAQEEILATTSPSPGDFETFIHRLDDLRFRAQNVADQKIIITHEKNHDESVKTCRVITKLYDDHLEDVKNEMEIINALVWFPFFSSDEEDEEEAGDGWNNSSITKFYESWKDLTIRSYTRYNEMVEYLYKPHRDRQEAAAAAESDES